MDINYLVINGQQSEILDFLKAFKNDLKEAITCSNYKEFDDLREEIKSCHNILYYDVSIDCVRYMYKQVDGFINKLEIKNFEFIENLYITILICNDEFEILRESFKNKYSIVQ